MVPVADRYRDKEDQEKRRQGIHDRLRNPYGDPTDRIVNNAGARTAGKQPVPMYTPPLTAQMPRAGIQTPRSRETPRNLISPGFQQPSYSTAPPTRFPPQAKDALAKDELRRRFENLRPAAGKGSNRNGNVSSGEDSEEESDEDDDDGQPSSDWAMRAVPAPMQQELTMSQTVDSLARWIRIGSPSLSMAAAQAEVRALLARPNPPRSSNQR
jgi:hypothetical protein